MNLFLILLLVLVQQENGIHGTNESFSQLVQLYQYAETQLNEMKTMFSTVMENAALQQKKFSNELRDETFAYMDEVKSLMESDSNSNPEAIRSKLSNCARDVDDLIENAINQFVNILDDAELMVNVMEDRLRTEPSSDDIDEINDEVDDILDECKENFDIKILPLVENVLRQLKNKLVSLRSDIDRCVSEEIKLF